MNSSDEITDAHEAEVRAAHDGHAVLKELTRIDTEAIPELTVRNVLKATDNHTIVTVAVLAFVYWCGLNALQLPTAQVSHLRKSLFSLVLTQPQIAFMVKDLGDSASASWISTASSAALAVVTPTISGITDLVGRRWALIIGCVFGVIGSVVAGSAQTLPIIIAGQVRTLFYTTGEIAHEKSRFSTVLQLP